MRYLAIKLINQNAVEKFITTWQTILLRSNTELRHVQKMEQKLN